MEQPRPPRPASVTSLPKREITFLEFNPGHRYLLRPDEALRVITGDVAVFLLIDADAEPIFCYDGRKDALVNFEALVDPFELQGTLCIITQETTKLEIIPAEKFRCDYARMIGGAGALEHFRPTELQEISRLIAKTAFRLSKGHRDLVAEDARRTHERRIQASKAAFAAALRIPDVGETLRRFLEQRDAALIERLSGLLSAAHGIEPDEAKPSVQQALKMVARSMPLPAAGTPTPTTSPEPPPPPPAREKFATLTGEDGLGGLIPVTEEEPPPPAWLAAEPTSDIHNRITPINVPPPTTQPSPRTSTIGQPPVASRRLTLPFIQAPPEHADRPASPPPAPSVRIDAPRQEPAPEPKANDFEEDDFEIVDGVRIAKRTTALGLDPISSQWADVHRSSAPPAPVPKPPPPPSNPRGGLDRTLSGVGGMMPPQSKPRPSAPGSAPKPPPLPPRSR